MKRVVLVLFLVAIIVAGAQSSMPGKGSAQETQTRGYWNDPSTHSCGAQRTTATTFRGVRQ